MIRWWHPGRYHGGGYHNWLVGRFDRPGQLHLHLNHSQTDRVESCWLVELTGAFHAAGMKKVILGSPVSGQYQLEQRLEPHMAFAVRFEHRPLLPAWQNRPLVLGRAMFLPDDAAAEEHVFAVPPERGFPVSIPPETAVEAVRCLSYEDREGATPRVPAIRLYPSGDINVEIRLDVAMDRDVHLVTGERLPEASPGQIVKIVELEHAGFARLEVIDAGRRSKTTRKPTGDFFVVPVAIENHGQSGTLGNPVRFTRMPAVSDITGEFADNGELHLQWNWQTNTRVRVLVRSDGAKRRGQCWELRERTTANQYAERNYFLVSRDWLDAVIDAESCTKLQVTIESLHHDDTGGIGLALATRSTPLPIPKRRLQR